MYLSSLPQLYHDTIQGHYWNGTILLSLRQEHLWGWMGLIPNAFWAFMSFYAIFSASAFSQSVVTSVALGVLASSNIYHPFICYLGSNASQETGTHFSTGFHIWAKALIKAWVRMWEFYQLLWSRLQVLSLGWVSERILYLGNITTVTKYGQILMTPFRKQDITLCKLIKESGVRWHQIFMWNSKIEDGINFRNWESVWSLRNGKIATAVI